MKYKGCVNVSKTSHNRTQRILSDLNFYGETALKVEYYTVYRTQLGLRKYQSGITHEISGSNCQTVEYWNTEIPSIEGIV